MAALARAPGSSALKSNSGVTWMKRRNSSGFGAVPVISDRQERNWVLPCAAASSTSPIRTMGVSISDSLASPCETPKSTADSESITPRSEGSSANAPRNGWALINCRAVDWTSFKGRNRRPL